MKIIANKVNGQELGSLKWVGMGELIADTPNTVENGYTLVNLNFYDLGEALMLWQDGVNGKLLILDTSELDLEARVAIAKEFDGGVKDYMELVMEKI